MVKAHVIVMPNFIQPFILETDAYASGIGFVLMQMGQPIDFLVKPCIPKTMPYLLIRRNFWLS